MGTCVPANGGCVGAACARADAGPNGDAAPTTDAMIGVDADLDAATGIDASPDAAPGTDAMAGMDAAPLADAGFLQLFDAGTDGGTADATALPSTGFTWYGEYNDQSTQAFSMYGDFINRAGAGYTVVEHRFPDNQGTACTVKATHLISGTTTGYTAQRIVMRTENGTDTRELVPDPAQLGHFIPAIAPQLGFFDEIGLFVHIESTGGSGTLGELQIYPAGPNLLNVPTVTPAPGTPIDMLAGVTLNWTPNPFGGGGDTIVEAYDATHEVVLRCSIFDSGSYPIPIEAIRDWYNETPRPPAYLELRYQIDHAPEDVPIIGSTTPLSTTFRFTRGVRWSVQ